MGPALCLNSNPPAKLKTAPLLCSPAMLWLTSPPAAQVFLLSHVSLNSCACRVPQSWSSYMETGSPPDTLRQSHLLFSPPPCENSLQIHRSSVKLLVPLLQQVWPNCLHAVPQASQQPSCLSFTLSLGKHNFSIFSHFRQTLGLCESCHRQFSLQLQFLTDKEVGASAREHRRDAGGTDVPTAWDCLKSPCETTSSCCFPRKSATDGVSDHRKMMEIPY